MATIASLVVRIGADIADLVAKSNEANSKIDGFAARATKAFDALKGVAAFGAVAAGIGKIVAAADEIDTISSKISDTAENVQRLQAVSEAFDTSIEALAGGIGTLQQKLGAGEIDQHLADLNIEVEKFKNLSPTEQYIAVAKALGGIEDPAKRAAVAKDVLGKSAKELAGTFRDTVDQADRWIKMSDDTVAAMDRAGISWANVTGSVVNFSAELLMNITQLRTMIGLYDDWIARADNPALKGVKPNTMPTALAVPGMPDDVDWKYLHKDLDEGLKKTVALREAHEKAAEKAREHAKTFRDSVSLMSTAAGNWQMWQQYAVGAMDSATTAASKFTDAMFRTLTAIDLSARAWEPFKQGVKDSREELSKLHEATRAASTWAGVGKTFSSAIIGAVQGGGDIGKALGGTAGQMLGEKLGSTIASAVGGKLGAALGGAAGPIGAALGSLAGSFVGKLFGGGEGKQVNDLRDKVTAAAGGIEALNAKAVAAGTTLDAFFRANTVKSFEAAIADLDRKFSEFTARQAEVAGLQSEIERLTKATTVGFDEMNAVAKEFGLDIAALGPVFQQAKIDKEAQRIIDAMAIMQKGGADMNGVLAGMADEISKVVSDSLQFGTTIPENMKPWIDELMKSGTLVDASGKKITDISKLKFGDPMASEMEVFTKAIDELVAKLKEIVDKIGTGIPDALSRLPRETRVGVKLDVDDSGLWGERRFPAMATGGIVRRPTFALIGESGPEAVVPLNRLGSTTRGDGETHLHIHGGVFDGYASEQAFARRVLDVLSGERERRSGRALAFAGA